MQGQTQFCRVSTQSNCTNYGFYNCVHCAMERAPDCNFRIVTASHYGSSGSSAVKYGDSAYHTFGRGDLSFATKGHHYSTTADGAIETFGHTFLAANVQTSQVAKPSSFQVSSFCNFSRNFIKYVFCFSIFNYDAGVLSYAVSVEECTRQVNNFVASPVHNKTRVSRYFCNNGCFQVFLVSKFNEGIFISSFNYYCHTFLRFGDSKFSAVQTFIFFRNFIQVNYETVGQFANRYRYTACTEVVAAFNHCSNFRIAEQALDFAFSRRIAFLNFCTAAHQRVYSMFFRRTGCTAAAVTTSLTTQKYYDIAGSRTFTTNCATGSSTNYSANFHTFSNEFFIVVFLYVTGSKTNLVTVGAIACSSTNGDFALGQFAFNSFRNRNAGVSSASYAHCLIYIGTTGQRVTNRTTQASSCTTERFDFSRMVVSFVFEHYKPFFGVAINFDGNNDGACIDFFGFVQVSKLAFFTQFFHTDYCDIHQGYRAFSIFTVNAIASCHVFIISFLYRFGVNAGYDFYIFNLSHEGGVTAVVRPVGVKYANFSNGRFAVFFIKVFLAPEQIFNAHCQAHFFTQSFCFFTSHGQETSDACNFSRFFASAFQSFRFAPFSFASFNRVDAVCFNFSNFIFAQFAFKNIYFSSCNHRTIFLGNQLNALFRKVFALVVLTGQQFHSKCVCASFQSKFFFQNFVNGRFRKNQFFCHCKFFVIQTHNIVTVHHTNVFQGSHAKIVAQVSQKTMCFNGKSIFLFHKNSSNHTHYTSLQVYFEVN